MMNLRYTSARAQHKEPLCDLASGGVRRSNRTRVRTLEWFRNERIHYERQGSEFVVAGVYSPNVEGKAGAIQKIIENVVHGKKLCENKRHIKQNPSICPEQTPKLTSRSHSKIRVIDPKTQEEVLMECVKTSDQARMVGVSDKQPTDDDSLLMCKLIHQNTFASGTLILQPLQIKKTQCLHKDTMLFHVIHGNVEVTIHQTNFFAGARDKFFVPVGNSYSIRNLCNQDAELDFTQITVNPEQY